MIKKYFKKNIKKIVIISAIVLLFVLTLSIIFLTINYNLKKITKKNNDIILTIKDNSPIDIFAFKGFIDKFNNENKNYNVILEMVDDNDDLKFNSDIYLESYTAGALYSEDILSPYNILGESNNKRYLGDLIIDESKKQLLVNDEIINIEDENLINKKNVIYGFFSMFTNKDLLYDLFEIINSEKEILLDSLIKCTYSEFKTFVNQIEKFLINPNRSKVILNKKSFYLKSYKTDNVKKMNSVFATSKYEETTKLDNIISSFDNTFLTTNTISKIISDFNFESKHISGEFGKAIRGNTLISSDNFNVDTSLELFSNNKALFFYLNDVTYQKFVFNFESKKKSLKLIPIKSPLSNVNNKVFIKDFFSFKLNNKDKSTKIKIKLLNFLNANIKKFAPTFNDTVQSFYSTRLVNNELTKIDKQTISKIASMLLSEKSYSSEFVLEIEGKFLKEVYQ